MIDLIPLEGVGQPLFFEVTLSTNSVVTEI